MFKIKGFYLFCLFVLSLVYQPVAAQKKDSVACYGQGKEALDKSIPCCPGLQRLTERDTHKIFCDAPPEPASAFLTWTLILIFPGFLLVFLIFGIRNKMALRKNKPNE